MACYWLNASTLPARAQAIAPSQLLAIFGYWGCLEWVIDGRFVINEHSTTKKCSEWKTYPIGMRVAAALGKSNVLGFKVNPGGGRPIGFSDIVSTLRTITISDNAFLWLMQIFTTWIKVIFTNKWVQWIAMWCNFSKLIICCFNFFNMFFSAVTFISRELKGLRNSNSWCIADRWTILKPWYIHHKRNILSYYQVLTESQN